MNSKFTVNERFSVKAKNYEVVKICIVIFTKMFVRWQELCIMYMHQNMVSLKILEIILPLQLYLFKNYIYEVTKQCSYFLLIKFT